MKPFAQRQGVINPRSLLAASFMVVVALGFWVTLRDNQSSADIASEDDITNSPTTEFSNTPTPSDMTSSPDPTDSGTSDPATSPSGGSSPQGTTAPGSTPSSGATPTGQGSSSTTPSSSGTPGKITKQTPSPTPSVKNILTKSASPGQTTRPGSGPIARPVPTTTVAADGTVVTLVDPLQEMARSEMESSSFLTLVGQSGPKASFVYGEYLAAAQESRMSWRGALRLVQRAIEESVVADCQQDRFVDCFWGRLGSGTFLY